MAADWAPLEVEFIREDEGRTFQEADLPWMRGDALVMRPAAVVVIAPLVEGQAELLPLACDETELWLLHVTECRDS